MKEEELSDRMDRLSESLCHGSPLIGNKELKYDQHSTKCGEFFGKNDEVLQCGSNMWCWDIRGITYDTGY